MSERDYTVYLKDIQIACERILRYSNGLELDAFKNNDMVVDAVIRNLEIIGEAVKNLPQQIRKKYPGIDWKKIAGLRDVLIHEYFGVDHELIWDIIQNKVIDLKLQIENILREII